MPTLTITLPLPSADLSPNARVYHIRKAAAVKKARTDAGYATLDAMNRAGIKGGWKTATVKATFYFREKRRRDGDNMAICLKPSGDGIADAKLIVNDCGLTWLPPELLIDASNPRVVLEVTETT